MPRAAIAVAASGEFVIGWFDPQPPGHVLRAQRFTRDAVPVGGEILVRSNRTFSGQLQAAITGDGVGRRIRLSPERRRSAGR